MAIFLVFATIAYLLNVFANFPFLTGTLFGLALLISLKNQKVVSKLWFGLITIFWSSLLFLIVIILVLIAVKDAFNGIPIGSDEALKVGMAIGLLNGFGFAVYKNIILRNLKFTSYHRECFIISLIIGLLVGALIVFSSSYVSLLLAHMVWFCGMGGLITKEKNGIANVLMFKNSKQ